MDGTPGGSGTPPRFNGAPNCRRWPDQIAWRQAGPGVEWGELSLAGRGGTLPGPGDRGPARSGRARVPADQAGGRAGLRRPVGHRRGARGGRLRGQCRPVHRPALGMAGRRGPGAAAPRYRPAGAGRRRGPRRGGTTRSVPTRWRAARSGAWLAFQSYPTLLEGDGEHSAPAATRTAWASTSPTAMRGWPSASSVTDGCSSP